MVISGEVEEATAVRFRITEVRDPTALGQVAGFALVRIGRVGSRSESCEHRIGMWADPIVCLGGGCMSCTGE